MEIKLQLDFIASKALSIFYISLYEEESNTSAFLMKKIYRKFAAHIALHSIKSSENTIRMLFFVKSKKKFLKSPQMQMHVLRGYLFYSSLLLNPISYAHATFWEFSISLCWI